jgi:hypothetical protein
MRSMREWMAGGRLPPDPHVLRAGGQNAYFDGYPDMAHAVIVASEPIRQLRAPPRPV